MKQDYKDNNEIDLIDYLKIIYRRRWIVLAIVIFGVVFSGIQSIRQPELYEASATFFPLTMSYNIQSQGQMSRPQLDITDMIVAIFESRSMADRVIEQLDLKKLWSLKSMGAAEKALKNTTSTSFEQKGIIRLSVSTASAELSVKIANAYVDNLEYFNTQFDITSQRQIVQVIDRATVPDTRMPRSTVKKVITTGSIYFIVAICLIFLSDFIKRNNVIDRITKE